MGSTLMKLLLIVLFMILLQCNDGIVEGARDVELERQLRILNKTPIKTIWTNVGDVFDCIDINKQPSLEHPLLKNHVIKTRPTGSNSINTMVEDDHHVAGLSSSLSNLPSSKKPSSRIAILRNLDCPDGTVPIRRTFKKDLIRAKSFSKLSQLLHSSINNVGDQLGDDLEVPGQGQFLSIAKTQKDSGIKYLGIGAIINLYNPLVTENQVSTAQLWIENGPKEQLNSLQAGWIVAPSLFGDNETRFFGKWQIEGIKSEGCYNIFCPGFIQVDKDHPIGGIINGMSQMAGLQYDLKFSISQDNTNHWWLSIGDFNIGYWPAELVSQLTSGSSVIAWGGLAQGAVATSVPQTGNGNYPYPFEDFTRQCYMRQMKVVPAKTLHWEDPTSDIIETYATNFECSDILYYRNLNRRHKGFGHTIGFGGPGGNCRRVTVESYQHK